MSRALRILVTGAGGFLGSWVARALAQRGYGVRGLVRRANGARGLEALGVSSFQGDVLNEKALSEALVGMNVVVHCAARVSLRPRDRTELYRTNVVGTENVLRLAASAGARVIHTSTTGTIGPTSSPLQLDEAAPHLPLLFDYPYADSKRQAEDLALAFARRGHDVVVLNPGIILGPGDVHYASTEIILRYLRGEPALHLCGGSSFCDVRDVASAYVNAIERGQSGQRYILAGTNRSYAELMGQLQHLTGLAHSQLVPRLFAEWGGYVSELQSLIGPHPFESVNLSVVRWGSLFNYCSSNKAERELGYHRRDLSETLVDTIGDHLSRGAARASTSQLRALLARIQQRGTGTGPRCSGADSVSDSPAFP